MKKLSFLLFTLYTWLRIVYGLVFHPYKTVREIVRNPVLSPVLITPFLSLLTLFVLGRIGALLIELSMKTRILVAMSLSVSLFAILLWQILLFYLLLSLVSAKRR